MNIHVKKTKMRRHVEDRMNSLSRKAAKIAGDSLACHFKYTHHFIEDLANRDIDINHVYALINLSLENHFKEYSKFLSLPYRPFWQESIDESIEYRPTRLEITDGTLWIGITSDKPLVNCEVTNIGLTCRMAIINPLRLPSRVSTQLIKVTR